jgi:DNA-binding protein YbaB
MWRLDNDAARHDLTEALALVQEHMADLAIVEKKRAALSATATAADGTVVVTVDARGVVSTAAVDESYFDDYGLAELGHYVTAAARAAAGDVERQTAELLAPLADRRAQFPSLSEVVKGAPDIRDLVPHLNPVDQQQQYAGNDNHGGEDTGDYPIVRS